LLLTDLCNAVTLLTRIPLGRLAEPRTWSDPGRCVWAFPLVGLLVNVIAAAVYWFGHALSVPPLAGAVWALAVSMLATGALHEDGLADTADGFGGGDTPERKLEIMRDSRIGCYGALALVLAVITRVGAIAALDDPRRVLAALIAAGMLGRGGILVLLALLRSARPDGLAASLGAIPRFSIVLGLGTAVIGAALALSAQATLAAVILIAGVALGMAKLAQSEIGGYTGDVLGAVEVIAECVVLTAAASAFAA
jgi:adenosylcobinamide-GDP ribazoletransferase